ncbi:hypothetical protein LJK88_05865 [Paenibacillus sp. P26]|nr:hypothetical protein LJK88_05865 [Paenibacillus sp. P26]UUZ90441.1 hypothetical protein LJK87_31635 [Paenibacillus sp. P25]
MNTSSGKTLAERNRLAAAVLPGLGGFLTVFLAMEIGSWSDVTLMMAPSAHRASLPSPCRAVRWPDREASSAGMY